MRAFRGPLAPTGFPGSGIVPEMTLLAAEEAPTTGTRHGRAALFDQGPGASLAWLPM